MEHDHGACARLRELNALRKPDAGSERHALADRVRELRIAVMVRKLPRKQLAFHESHTLPSLL